MDLEDRVESLERKILVDVKRRVGLGRKLVAQDSRRLDKHRQVALKSNSVERRGYMYA